VSRAQAREARGRVEGEITLEFGDDRAFVLNPQLFGRRLNFVDFGLARAAADGHRTANEQVRRVQPSADDLAFHETLIAFCFQIALHPRIPLRQKYHGRPHSEQIGVLIGEPLLQWIYGGLPSVETLVLDDL